MSSALLAYQPIYDQNRAIAGGELLYRDDQGLSALDVGEEQATSDVIFNLCTSISDQFAGFQHPLYLNVSHAFVCADTFIPLDPASVVIELVERIEPDAELIEAVQRWRERGFRFALDDFCFTPSWQPLVEMADIIKVDISQQSAEQVAAHKAELFAPHIRWLAERVETKQDFETYRNLGFSLFQGYFLARPEIITGARLPPGAAQVAKILQELYVDEVDIAALSRAVERDPGVSLKLLKVANSPLYRGHRSITSMQQALMRIGTEQIRKWLVLINCLKHSSAGATHLVLTRASACAEAARLVRDEQVTPEQAFLVGLLSGTDLLMNVDKRQFLDELDISAAVREAALNGRGLLGGVLSSVLNVEQAVSGKPVKRVSGKVLSVYQQQSMQTQSVLCALDIAF